MVIGLALHATKNGVAYLWPAYLTHKTMQYGTSEEQQQWTVYWCVLAFCTAIEFICDIFLFWIPFYRLLKILIVLYLWHPQTQGAQLIYARFLCPYLKEHESKIDAAAEEAQEWLRQKSCLWREQVYEALGKGAVMAIEKAQELGSPSNSPRIAAVRGGRHPIHAATAHECKNR